MSDRVDKRIVEMQFNNAQFKTGVAETLNMLKNLDKALLFENGQKGFADIQAAANKVDLSSMVKDIDNVEESLGGLKGVAASVIETVGGIAGTFGKVTGIAGGIMGIGVISKSIQGGLNRAGNLAQAKFTMEGLGITGQRLTDVMDRVNKSVDGTAYGLDAAAVAASSLSASGVQDLDKLETTLKSIAGTAAMTGRDYSDISNIFTTIAGQGKVMTMQLRQLEMSGMNAAASIAKYAREHWEGWESVGEAEIREMVTQGDISFDMFAEAMSQYADQAAKANETFTGASANIGSALGRTTADFFEQVMGMNGLVPILNDVRVFINGLNSATTSLMHSWTEMGEDAEGNAVEIKHWGAVIEGTNHVLREFNEGFRDVLKMDEKEKATGEFFTKFKETFDLLAPSVSRFFGFFANGAREFAHLVANLISIIRAVFHVIVSVMDPITNAFNKVFGLSLGPFLETLSNGAGAIADFIDKLALTEPMAMILQGVFTILFQAIKLVSDIVGGALTVAFRVFMGVINVIIDIVHALFDAFGAVNSGVNGLLGGIVNFFSSIGGPFGDFFRDLATHMRSFSEGIASGIPVLDAISTVLKGFDYGVIKIFDALNFGFDFVDQAKVAIVEALKMAIGGLALAVKGLLEFLAPVGDAIYNGLLGGLTAVSEFVESTGVIDFFNELGAAVESLFSGDSALGGEMADNIGEAASQLSEFVNGVREFAEAARDTAIQTFGNVFETIGKVLKGIKDALDPVIASIQENAVKLFEIVANAASQVGLSFEPFTNFFKSIFDKIGEFFNGFEDGIPTLEEVIEFLGSLKDEFFAMIDEVAPKFGEFMSQIGADAAEQLDGPLGDLIKFANGLGDALLNLPDTIVHIPDAIGGMLGQFAHLLDHPFGGGDQGVVGSLQEGVNEISETGFSLVDSLTLIKNKLKQPWDTVYEFLHDGVDGGLKGIADAINEHLMAINPENIQQFTNSIMGIAGAAGSVWALFAVDKFLSNAAMLVGNVANIAYTIDLMFGAIRTAVQNISNAITKDIKANAFAKRMLSLGVALLSIAGALYIISLIPTEKLGVSAAILAGFLVVMVGLFALLEWAEKKFEWNDMGVAATFIAMGLSLLAIAKAIEILGSMDSNQLQQGAATMTGLIVLIGIMVAVAGATNVGMGAAAAIAAFAFSLGIMIAALMILPLFFNRDNLEYTITAFVDLAIILAMLAGACYLLSFAQGPIAKGGKAILRISLALLPIVAALTVLTVLGHFDVNSTVTSVFLLILLLAAMAGLVIALSKFKGTQQYAMKNIVNIFSDLGKAMLALSVCIALMTAAVALNPDATVGAMVIVIGTLYALVIAMVILAKAGPQAAAAGKTLIGLAVAMAVLSAAIFVLALLPSEKVITVAIALAVVMGVLAGLAAVVGHFGTQLDAAVPGILALVVAIGLLAAIMVVLGMDGVVEQAAKGLLVLVGVVLVLIGLAAAVTAMAAIFQVFNMTLIELGIGLALIAASALMFAAALWIMHDIGVDAILSTAEELGSNTARVQSAAEGIGRALVAGIIGGITGVVGGIADALGSAIGGAIDAVSHTYDEQANNLGGNIYMEYQDGMTSQDWSATGKEAGEKQAEGTAEGIKENSDKIEEAGKETGDAAGEASADAMKDKINSMLKSGDTIEPESGDAMSDEFSKMLDGVMDTDQLTSEFGNLGSGFGDLLGPSIMDGAGDNPINPTELMGSLNLSPDKTEEASKESGEGIGTNLLAGLQEKLAGGEDDEVSGALDVQKEVLESKADDFKQAGNTVGSAYGTGVSEGVGNNVSIVISAVGKTAQSLSEGEGPAKTSGNTVGAGFGTSIVSKIQSYTSPAKSAATRVSHSAGSVDGKPDGRGVGRDFGDGYIQGVDSKTKAAYDAGVKLAKAAKQGVQDGQKSKSPSKVAMGLGNDFTDGYAIGIEQVGKRVSQAAEDIVDDATTPLSQSLHLMSDLFEMVDWDSDPVITPVLDLDNFERGIGRMNDLTASGSLIGASWADRITPRILDETSSSPSQNNLTVILDYKAGQTPNQIVKQIARELNAANMLGG